MYLSHRLTFRAFEGGCCRPAGQNTRNFLTVFDGAALIADWRRRSCRRRRQLRWPLRRPLYRRVGSFPQLIMSDQRHRERLGGACNFRYHRASSIRGANDGDIHLRPRNKAKVVVAGVVGLLREEDGDNKPPSPAMSCQARSEHLDGISRVPFGPQFDNRAHCATERYRRPARRCKVTGCAPALNLCGSDQVKRLNHARPSSRKTDVPLVRHRPRPHRCDIRHLLRLRSGVSKSV